MALILRQSGSLKPEIRLAQAVLEFEATLTPEQKASFQATRDQAVSTTPTMSDVMRLTAEIDLKTTCKHGRGRCFGPRMTNTLQAIQQFAALGDIIIGGSQNLVACGVWAASRMTLHIITGYFTYLENLSLLFMDIGRNAPRYQSIAALYPKSKTLQGYLCEYFIIITKICYHSITWTKKSSFARLSSAVSDPQLKAFKDDLDIWSASIREETNLLLNEKVADESKQNSIFRSLTTFRYDASARQRTVERQIRVLDACSQYEYRTTWKQNRKLGTTKFTTTCPQYQEWKVASMETSILFLGKLGSGKSVLLANIVDDLNLQNNAITLYFFSHHDIEDSMKARTILGSLTRQLLEHLMGDTEFDHLFPEVVSPRDVDEFVDTFKLGKPKDTTVSVVLDGLDECETEVQRMVLNYLKSIQAFGYKVCLSVRTSEHGPIWDTVSFHHCVYIPEKNPDISDFVQVEVDNRVRDGRLVTRDPDLVEEIKHELIAGACGMFLWASLQLDSICDEVCDHDIREAIQNLPRDLTETFQRNITKASSRDSKRHHVRIFKLLVSARELLTAEQLRQAASVTVGQTVWNSDKEINSIFPLLKFCGSLIMVDEEDETVRFIHHSARSFCIEGFHSATDWTFSELDADQYMAEILVTYLSWNVFETRVSKTVVPTIDAKEMPKRVALNAISQYHIGTSIAERLLRSKSRFKRNIGPTLAKVSVGQTQPDEPFPLLKYAHKHWLRHTAHLQDLPLLPGWHTLLSHPSFGIGHEHSLVRLVDVTQIVREVVGRRNGPFGGSFEKPVLDSVWRKHYRILSAKFDEKRALYWALSNGHILTLKHELTKVGGSQRIRNYARLWHLLRHIALHNPSAIQNKLDYELVRWLCPMFVNLALDHPAKDYLLRRIPTSDDSYLTLVRSAVKQVDFEAICALLREDYKYECDLVPVEWRTNNGFIDHLTVPPSLKAAVSRLRWSPETTINKHRRGLWLFDIANWLFMMDSTHYRLGMRQQGPLSFSRAFESFRKVGVPEREVKLLERVLEATHDRHLGRIEENSILTQGNA